MLSYPPENERGRAIAWFWVIFNTGGAVGGFMSFGLNYKSKAGSVSDSTCSPNVLLEIYFALTVSPL